MRDENDFVDGKKDDEREQVGERVLSKMAEDRKSMRDKKYQNSWSKVERM